MSQEEKKKEKASEASSAPEKAEEKTSQPKEKAEEKKSEPNLKEENEKLLKEVQELKHQVKDYQSKFEEADKSADSWKNKYYEVYADMANARKQVERENNDFKKYAQQSFIEELIPTFDSFDMALKNEPKDPAIKAYVQGFQMIHSKLLYALQQNHVDIIDPKVGDDYDPNLMQAYSTVDGKEDNKVAEVYTKGYKLYDHLLRPAGVIITKKAVEEKKADAEEKKEDVPADSKESDNE